MKFLPFKNLSVILLYVFVFFSCTNESTSKDAEKAKSEEKPDFSDADVFENQGEEGEEIFQAVKDTPEFIGGKKKMYEFINSNVRHPREAAENGVSGLVYVRFVVEKNGKITNPKLLKGIGSGCDEEAIRVIAMMPKWKPGAHNGKVVRCYHTLPIAFQKVKVK